MLAIAFLTFSLEKTDFFKKPVFCSVGFLKRKVNTESIPLAITR
jgi:hypothetical protein